MEWLIAESERTGGPGGEAFDGSDAGLEEVWVWVMKWCASDHVCDPADEDKPYWVMWADELDQIHGYVPNWQRPLRYWLLIDALGAHGAACLQDRFPDATWRTDSQMGPLLCNGRRWRPVLSLGVLPVGGS